MTRITSPQRPAEVRDAQVLAAVKDDPATCAEIVRRMGEAPTDSRKRCVRRRLTYLQARGIVVAVQRGEQRQWRRVPRP